MVVLCFCASACTTIACANSSSGFQLTAKDRFFTFLFILCIGAQQLEYATYNYLEPSSALFESIQYINVFRHLDDFALGIIDTRAFVFYLSVSALLTSFTVKLIDR